VCASVDCRLKDYVHDRGRRVGFLHWAEEGGRCLDIYLSKLYDRITTTLEGREDQVTITGRALNRKMRDRHGSNAYETEGKAGGNRPRFGLISFFFLRVKPRELVSLKVSTLRVYQEKEKKNTHTTQQHKQKKSLSLLLTPPPPPPVPSKVGLQNV